MIKNRSMTRVAAAVFLMAGIAGADFRPGHAAGSGLDGEVLVAQADCYSVGQRVAAQNGGQLANASQSNRGGQTVCVVVVVIPAKDGQRPRRVEFVVPAQ